MSSRKERCIASLVFMSLCVLAAWFLLTVPQDRNLGLIFRQKLYILPVMFAAAFFAVRAENTVLRSTLYALLFAFFLLPLSGLWNSGASNQYIFAGTIPWSDAFIHHLNTLRFLFGGTMGQSSAVRPLALNFYALILYLSDNNFLLVYALSAILAAGSVLLVLPLIIRQFGTVAAALFYVNAYFFIRLHLGSFMTEPYGFAVGMLSCALLLMGISQRRNGWIVAGFFALSLALNIRPGAMFVLATGGLWYFFIFLKNEKKRLLWAALALAAMLAGFALSSWNTKLVYEEGKKLTNDQAGFYLYGMCLGGKDTYFVMERPELYQLSGTDHFWSGLYGLCRAELSAHPENVGLSLKTIWDGILFDPERGAFSYFDGMREPFVSIVRYGLMLLWAGGLALTIKRRKDARYSFLLAMIFGVFLFQFAAPLYNYYRMRFDAPTNWITGIVVALPLQWILERLVRKPDVAAKQTSQKFSAGMAAAALCGVLLVGLVGLPLIRKAPLPIPAVEPLTCPAGEVSVLTRVDRGNAVYLHSYDLERPHAPDFHLLYVRPRLHDTSAREIFDFIDSFESPTAIFKGIDLNTLQDLLIFADLEKMEEKTGFVQLCGKVFDPPLYRDYQFMIASDVKFLQP